ncbi:MAG TPA: DUF1684 domain-containing protein [Bryobacteraceae bacterium]|nr:DUF1684 domain-containing protein [Bryobacteraceae bacterium]
MTATRWLQSILPLLAAVTLLRGADPYVAGIEKWRAEREARLKTDDGWLTVAGLFWLAEGDNMIGTSERDRVTLPSGAPARFGVIRFGGGRTHLTLHDGVEALVNGKRLRTAELRSDAATSGEPDIVTWRDLSFFIIKRGDRYGVRLKDKNSEYRRNFQGLAWYPVKPEWRIIARFVPYAEPKKVVLDSLTGDKQEETSPGVVTFKVNGREVRLEPTGPKDNLFFVFRDKTAGNSTYPAARFLYSKVQTNGTVILDFNKAYNPPCAFTPYATCPLPTPGNRLPFAIPAGELKYKGGGH